MANPLSGLKPALEVLARNVDILPATGQAVEDLLRPDHEEVEDSILSREDKRIDVIGERPNRALYVPTPPLPRPERHLFRRASPSLLLPEIRPHTSFADSPYNIHSSPFVKQNTDHIS